MLLKRVYAKVNLDNIKKNIDAIREHLPENTDITGIVLTKLDGTARGGVVLSITDELKIPVKFIGVGEKVDDLQPFDPKDFANAIFSGEE